MNDIEELTSKARILRLKSKFEIAKSYGSDQLTVPMPDLEALIAQLEAANEKLSKPVVLPPRRIASSFVDEEFSNKDLTAIYNAARIEFSVKITNAGFTVEDE